MVPFGIRNAILKNLSLVPSLCLVAACSGPTNMKLVINDDDALPRLPLTVEASLASVRVGTELSCSAPTRAALEEKARSTNKDVSAKDLAGIVIPPFSLQWQASDDGANFTDLADATQDTLTVRPGHKGRTLRCIPRWNGDPSYKPYLESAGWIVQNTPPEAPETVEIKPTALNAASTASCVAKGKPDVDGDALTLEVAWLIDGTVLPNESSPSVSGLFQKGQRVSCRARYQDTHATSPWTASEIVTLENSPPIPPLSVEITPTTPSRATAELTCRIQGLPLDVDGDPIETQFLWKVNGSAQGDWNPAAARLASTNLNPGDEVVCGLRVSDGISFSSILWSAAVSMQNSSPVVASVSVSADATPVTTGRHLTCSASASDLDGTAVTPSFAWQVGNAWGDFSTIPGANQATFTVPTGFRAKPMRCLVVVTDANDVSLSAQAASAPLVIANTPPIPPTAVSITEEAGGAVLRCGATGATDADGDSVSHNFRWFFASAPDTPIPGRTDSTTPNNFEKSSVVICKAQSWDGMDASTGWVASNTYTRNDVAPLTPLAPSLSPATATRDVAELTCLASGLPVDPDGDPAFFEFRWKKGNTLLGNWASGNNRLPRADFARGDEIRCGLRTTAAGASSQEAWSNPLTIANALPTLSVSASADATPVRAGGTLTCNATSNDNDLDDATLAILYRWQQTSNGSNWFDIGGATSSTFTVTGGLRGKSLRCHVTVADTQSAQVVTTSESFVVDNFAPSAPTGAALAPGVANVSSTLTCSGSGASDPDGDTISYLYEWLVDDVVVAAANAPTLSGAFTKNQRVKCRVRSSDGAAESSSLSSSELVIQNSPPSQPGVVSLTPSNPSRDNPTLSCTAAQISSDADGDPIAYEYRWTVNGTPTGGWSTGSGTLANSAFNRGQQLACGARATDGTTPSNERWSNSVTVENANPAITSVNVTSLPTLVQVGSVLTCATTVVDNDPSDTPTVSHQWQISNNGSSWNDLAGATSGTFTVQSGQARKFLRCSVSANDSSGGTATGTSSPLIVENATPSPPTTVTLTPTTAYANSTFTCASAGGADADGDAIASQVEWYVDDVLVTGQSWPTLSTGFSKGKAVKCRTRSTDGSSQSSWVASDPVTVQNAAPSAPLSASVSPATATKATTTLSCQAVEASTDVDGDALAYQYLWQVDGADVGSWAAGATTLGSANYARGKSVRCGVRASDGTALSAATWATPITIANAAPTVSALSVLPATPQVGTTLTCTPTVTDVDGDTPSTAFTWEKSADTLAWATIAGATTNTHAVTLAEARHYVRCSVALNDGNGGSTTAQSAAVRIQNTTPSSPATVSVSPASPAANSTLTCNASGATDADADTLHYDYEWFVDAVVQAGQNAATLATGFAKNKQVHCRARANDNVAASAWVAAAAVTVQNSAPTQPGVASVNPASPRKGDSQLTCNAVQSSTDADGDSLTYEYLWRVNGADLGSWAAGASTLAAANFARGNTVACGTRAHDGTVAGTARWSANATVINTTPQISAMTLGASPVVGTAVSCNVTRSDADGDALTVTYQWQSSPDGTTWNNLGGATGSSYTPLSGMAGQMLRCSAGVNDGNGGSTSAESLASVILNTRPGNPTTVTVTPATAYRNTSLTCNASGAVDPNPGDVVTYTYQWYVNGTLQTGVTGSVLTGAFSKGQNVECEAKSFDGLAYGLAFVRSTPVTILNSTPSTPSAPAIAESAASKATAALHCGGGTSSTDTDGDVLTFQYRWRIGAVEIGAWGATNTSLTNANYARGNQVYCGIRATDGTVTTASQWSTALTIGNAQPQITAVNLTSDTTPVARASVLTCSATVVDADGDPVTPIYTWNPARAGTAANPYTVVPLDENKTFTCAASLAANADGNGSTAIAPITSSQALYVSPLPPDAPWNVSLSPAEPTPARDITVTGQGRNDTVVRLYLTSDCTGAPVANQTIAGGAFSLPVTVPAFSLMATLSLQTENGIGQKSACTVTPLYQRAAMNTGSFQTSGDAITSSSYFYQNMAYTTATGRSYFYSPDSATGGQLWTSNGTAATTVAIKRFETRVYGTSGNLGFFPLGSSGGTFYFILTETGMGRFTVWRSDGTTQGTVAVGYENSLWPTSTLSEMFVKRYGTAANKLLFTLGNRTETSYLDYRYGYLYSLDLATGEFIQITTNTGSAVLGLQKGVYSATSGKYYFLTSANTLLATNGTVSGTTSVSPGVTWSGSSMRNIAILNDWIYFVGYNTTYGNELYKIDMNLANLTLVKDITAGATGTTLCNFGNAGSYVMFKAGSYLWRSDGTAAGTVQVKPVQIDTCGSGIEATSRFESFSHNGLYYFKVIGTNAGLWRSNGGLGTADANDDANNKRLSTTSPGYDPGPDCTNMAPAGTGVVYSSSNDCTSGSILFTDGTNAATNVGLTSGVIKITGGGEVFIGGRNGNGAHVVGKHNGTSFTTLATGVFGIASSNPLPIDGAGTRAGFWAQKGLSGYDFFTTDGTQANTFMPAKSNTVTRTTATVTLGSHTYFAAWNKMYRAMNSGSGPSIEEVLEEAPAVGFDSIHRFLTSGARLFALIQRTGEQGLRLFVLNASNRLEMVSTSPLIPLLSGTPFAEALPGSKIVFQGWDAVNGFELWVSDGTGAGTFLVKDINPGTASSNLEVSKILGTLGTSLFFTAQDATNGVEVWYTDGTTAGTSLVEDRVAGASGLTIAYPIPAVGTRLYFVCYGGDIPFSRLCYIDETSKNSVKFFTTMSGYAYSSPGLYSAGVLSDTLYLPVTTAEEGQEIAKVTLSDTTDGTVLPLTPGAGSGASLVGTVVHGSFWFWYTNATVGTELWKYTPGTGYAMVADLNPGTGHCNPTTIRASTTTPGAWVHCAHSTSRQVFWVSASGASQLLLGAVYGAPSITALPDGNATIMTHDESNQYAVTPWNLWHARPGQEPSLLHTFSSIRWSAGPQALLLPAGVAFFDIDLTTSLTKLLIF